MQQTLSGMLLGELLVMHRVVSPVDVAAALAVQRGRPTTSAGGVTSGSRQLGRILVERDLLTESGLQRALLAQKRLGGNLGDILIERGYVSPAADRRRRSPTRTAGNAPTSIPHPAGRRGARGALRGARTGSVEEPLHVSDSFLDATRLRVRSDRAARIRTRSRSSACERTIASRSGRTAAKRPSAIATRTGAPPDLARARRASRPPANATASRPTSSTSGSAKKPWNMPS